MSNIVRSKIGAGALVIGLLASACGGSSSVGEAEMTQWEDAGLTEYTLTYKTSGGSGELGPKTVRVSNGEVIEIISEPDPDLVMPDYTIEELFTQLKDADVVVRADFDPELGYPTLLDLDPIEGAIDDEFSVVVVSLEER